MHRIILEFIGNNPKEYFCSYSNEDIIYPSDKDIKNYSLVEVDLISWDDFIIVLDECCRSTWDFNGNYVDGMLYDKNWKISENSLNFIKNLKMG